MKTKTKLYIIGMIFIILAIIICIFIAISKTNTTSKDKGQVEFVDIEAEYDKDDEDLFWKDDNVTYIDLNNESNVKISKSGTYHLSGTIENGSVTIDAKDNDIVKLVLENANITCKNSSPIYVENADKVIILLEKGSTNTLIDGSTYSNLDEEEEPNATIFSKDDLVINGKGILNITANYQDGIASKDDLKILNVNLNITANDDGIRGKDSALIKNATITIKSNGDGIKSTEDTDTEKGYIIIENGNINIEAEQDGIQAETVLKIESGEFNITTGGGSQNSSSNNMGMWGREQIKTTSNTTTTDEISTKGLKGVSQIQIISGTFNINSSDDSIHSNGIIVIENGNFEISSGDDGIHSDENLTIDNGIINISKSYEGIESKIITINNGMINIVASDDRNKCCRWK